MTLEQIAMMAAAAKTLKEGGAYEAHVYGHAGPQIHLPSQRFVSVLSDIGAPVVVEHHPSNVREFWRASVAYRDVTFFALFDPDQLTQIGYRLVGRRPVPITEEVR